MQGATPLEAWPEKAQHLITFDPTVNLEEIFYHEITRKVYRDSTVTVNNILYEVPSIRCVSGLACVSLATAWTTASAAW